jgi:hypothetical protein
MFQQLFPEERSKPNSVQEHDDVIKCYLLLLPASCWSLVDSLFNPEVGSGMFFRNVGWLPTDFTGLFVPESINLHYHRCENLKFNLALHLTLGNDWHKITRVKLLANKMRKNLPHLTLQSVSLPSCLRSWHFLLCRPICSVNNYKWRNIWRLLSSGIWRCVAL